MNGSTRSVVVSGLDGVVVDIQVASHPDVAARSGSVWSASRDLLRELRERVRAATSNSRQPWPVEPVTIELSPPVVPLAMCDLAVACAVQVATGAVPAGRLAHTVLLGELGLDGRIRPVRGVLPALLAAQRAGVRHAVVPRSALPEAGCVPGIESYGAEHLSEVISWLAGHVALTPVGSSTSDTGSDPGDLVDVVGQPQARRALEVAAAGGHHLLLIGPCGSGKSMLAIRLPGLLPSLSEEQALQVTAIHSVAGSLSPESPLITVPPFVAPHHSTSVGALLGGGTGVAKPGAISKAHHGVLFLDEAGEFGTQRLDAVRTAVEDGEIKLARRDGVVVYPTRFQLVLATNPCPCAPPREHDCVCSPHAKRRYLARLSGPLLDRVDLRVRMRPITTMSRSDIARPETTATVRERVMEARERATRRWRRHGWRTNSEVPGPVLRREFGLPHEMTVLLDRALDTGAVTARGADRCLRVSWTLADLAGLEQPGPDEIAEALAFRDRRSA